MTEHKLFVCGGPVFRGRTSAYYKPLEKFVDKALIKGPWPAGKYTEAELIERGIERAKLMIAPSYDYVEYYRQLNAEREHLPLCMSRTWQPNGEPMYACDLEPGHREDNGRHMHLSTMPGGYRLRVYWY